MMNYSEIKNQHPDWNIFPVVPDMNMIINCANCGKEIELGETYVSHNHFTSDRGFSSDGLQVCWECYLKERSHESTD